MTFSPKFTLPAPFVVAQHGPFANKKSVKCALTGIPINNGDLAYMVKFISYSDADRYYVSEEAARATPAFLQSLDNLEKRMHPASLMFYSDRSREELLDPYLQMLTRRLHMSWILEAKDEETQQWRSERYGISVAEAREEMAKPYTEKHKPLTDEELWDEIQNEIALLKKETDARRGIRAWKIFGPLVLCNLHRRLLDMFANLPPELRVLLACSDNLAFADLSEADGLLPDWHTVRALASKSRLSLDDMLEFASWGKKHPETLALLWATHVKFGILSFSFGAGIGFSEMMENGHSAHLLFLFTARPELCPMLKAFTPENYYQEEKLKREFYGFVDDTSYQKPYLYRARVFVALLAGNASEARRVVGLMREHVKYYYHGDPKGFINATEKMAEQYIKKYLK